jgi:hypothetical protein
MGRVCGTYNRVARFSRHNIPKRGKLYQIITQHYQIAMKYTKWPYKIPNIQHTKTWKIYHTTIKYIKWTQSIPNGQKIDHMAVKFTDIFHSKAHQNLPKFGFLVWKHTIWQPWVPTLLSVGNGLNGSCPREGAKSNLRMENIFRN